MSQVKRDPAPSRLRYRVNRVLLTPLYRRLLFVGLPVLALSGLFGIFLTEAERRAAIVAVYDAMMERFRERPEFMVAGLDVTGAEEALEQDIRSLLALEFPVSSFELDLEEMRVTLEQLARVETAAVRVGSDGRLDIAVRPRVPIAIWRTREGLRLIDETGTFSGRLGTRTDRSDLPVIAGLGARDHLPQALEIFDAARPLAGRVRGLVRVGERRWDLVLDRTQRIQLPTEAPVAALERVIALTEGDDMLARDIRVVDMRNPRRPTVRLSIPAAEELRNIREVEARGRNQ